MRIALACALVLAACGGAAAPSGAPSPATAPGAAASPTATVDPNLYLMMMGALPEATVFVVSGREIVAVTLLNHFVRYRIPVADGAQLAVSADGARLYVAEPVPGGIHFKWFDTLTGSLRVSRLESGALAGTGRGRGALAEDGQNLYVLEQRDDGNLVVQTYDGLDLRPARQPLVTDGCADRLLSVSLGRVAVVCQRGAVTIFGTQGHTRVAWRPQLTAAAIWWGTGEIAGVNLAGEISRIRSGATALEELTPAEWVKTAVALDGLAYADQYTLILVQDEPRPRIHVIDTVMERFRSFGLPNRPANGILASGQFAYWVDRDGSGVYHVDVRSGLVEKMYGPFEPGASLAALAIR